MRKQDLTATSWFTSRAGALFLAVVGLFFIFRPDWLGWSWLADAVGGETALVSVGVGCAFFLCASLAIEKDQLRVHAAEMMESLHALLFGKSYKQDREAIEILLNSIENADASASDTAYEHLKRLTGQNFAKDPKVWRSWWAAHQKTWARSSGAQDEEGPDVEFGRRRLMDDDTKNLVIKAAVVVALLVVVALSLRWFIRSDQQRISEAVDEARDALVELRDDDFLAVFTDDLVYRGDRDLAALRRDLASWRRAAIGSVIIVEKEIEVRGDEADVSLVVAAGQSVLQLGSVQVDLIAVKGEGGEWRVSSFDWRRR